MFKEVFTLEQFLVQGGYATSNSMLRAIERRGTGDLRPFWELLALTPEAGLDCERKYIQYLSGVILEQVLRGLNQDKILKIRIGAFCDIFTSPNIFISRWKRILHMEERFFFNDCGQVGMRKSSRPGGVEGVGEFSFKFKGKTVHSSEFLFFIEGKEGSLRFNLNSVVSDLRFLLVKTFSATVPPKALHIIYDEAVQC